MRPLTLDHIYLMYDAVILDTLVDGVHLRYPTERNPRRAVFDILTEEQKASAPALDDICARDVGGSEPRRALIDEGGTSSSTIYSKYADLGCLRLTVPEEYGGADAVAVGLCPLLEHSVKVLAP